jgi:hypothetical protein
MTRRDDRAYREYVREEQRSQPGAPTARTVRREMERGCIAGRMQLDFHHGLLEITTVGFRKQRQRRAEKAFTNSSSPTLMVARAMRSSSGSGPTRWNVR